MIDWQKTQKWVEAINNYYAFAVLVYVVALYVSGNTQFFLWIAIITTPLLAGWTGYLIRSFIERRNQRYGFKMVSDIMTYKIGTNRRYTLRYSTKIMASADHSLVYPVGYKWTGNGEEALPVVTGQGQQLLALVGRRNKRSGIIKFSPYKLATSTEGDWHYSFIALNPPVHRGEEVEIMYSQEFYDKKGIARPCLYYFVRTPMKRLELNIKFPANAPPIAITSSYSKPSDPSRPYLKTGVQYNTDKQWATWVIERPKKGYCYRIDWR